MFSGETLDLSINHLFPPYLVAAATFGWAHLGRGDLASNGPVGGEDEAEIRKMLANPASQDSRGTH